LQIGGSHTGLPPHLFQIATLNAEIDKTLASKNDGTMAGSVKGQQLAMIRAPPATKVRRILKGHFGKITVSGV
jgi:hypothetical protein